MALSHREGRMKRHLNSSTDGQLGQGTSEAKLSKEKEQQPRGEEQHIHLHRDGQAERVEEGMVEDQLQDYVPHAKTYPPPQRSLSPGQQAPGCGSHPELLQDIRWPEKRLRGRE